MEISEVRQRLLQAIARARRAEVERRARIDEASRDYETFLDRVAVPLFRQLANVLKAEGHPFSLSTPGSSVRLVSDRRADDYVELSLDTTGGEPEVILGARRLRGSRIIESEHPVAAAGVRDITEDALLASVLQELEPFLAR